ncbi:MAG TPA: hypothetical protein VNL97_00250 [Solirubrobacterales bacterium]|jgi:hypothetical protein|nr:hypothetical protein [Solirubrobacterales bacterium]
MASLARLRSRLRALAASESGMALPTALFAMIASFGFASVAVMSSVDAQHGTARDRSAKNAIAAADAGAGVALLRLNRFQKKLTTSTPCIGPAGEALTPTEGWCPTTAPETVGGSTFSYRVSAYQPNTEMSVVAVGASGGVSRRVNVRLAAKIEENVFKAEQLIGESNIHLEGGPTLETDIGTNGSVELTSSGNSYILCGDIRHGTGGTAPTPMGPPTCPDQGQVTEGNKTLPPVVPPEDIATKNSNCRLVPNCPKAEEVDVYQGQARTSTKPWDATQRFINVPTGASLTLGGGDYWICGLFINGTLYMAADRQIRIFFDTPEHCSGLDSSHTQVNVSASATIQSTGFGTTGGTYNVPGLYLIGSPTIPTTVTLTGSAGGLNEVMVYAPNSNIEISGNATWIGMFAGKTIRMNGNPTVKTDARIPLPEEFYVGLLERTRYVECTGATGSPPDVNC